ncbi:solute carrier organic anion transporter family member 5A1-like [Saccoglossus kowalevskii]|uniref:Solute carrier organic anion transporter family member n=1 Tax=Saccoglossus kowalevskii TaxID=10224 RepID=A0ABM0LUB6_SACKO|nr:PREDICTED: solute carrier organic anion transporter family member 5A1-like [Saccoglossus kowalevskii]
MDMDILENKQESSVDAIEHRATTKNPFNDIRFFVFCGFLFNLNVMWVTIAFVALLTTVEVRYELPSTQLASVVTVSMSATLVALPIVTYFFGRPTDQRPKWIAVGGMIVALGVSISAVPQFISDPYAYDEVKNDTSFGAVLEGLCVNDGENQGMWNATQCDEGGKKVATGGQLAYILFLVGNSLLGIGFAPTQTLILSYIDDNAGDNAPLYIGFYEASLGLGPPLGFFIAGICLRYYVDFYRVDMTTINISMKDPRWVGAWWMVSCIGAISMLVIAIPMFFFPKAMEVPSPTKIAKQKRPPKKTVDSAVQQNGLLKTLKDYVRVYARLLSSGVFLLAICGFSINRPVGFALFLPKFFQRMALLNPSFTSVLMGLTWLLPNVLSTITTGYIIKKLHLTLTGVIKMVLVLSVISVISSWLLLAFPCEGIDFTNPEDGTVAMRNEHLSASCNSDCGCSTEHYQPVCGSDGRNYFSPCYAGCSDFPSDKKFTNCTCISTNTDTATEARYVSQGLCPKDACQGNLIPFIIVLVIFALFNSAGIIPSINITMRVVAEEDKSVALGLRYICVRLINYIPGSIIAGHVIDSSCAIWKTKCGKNGVCTAFNGDKFRYMFVGITAGETVIALFLHIVLYVLVRRKENKKAAKERVTPSSGGCENAARLADCDAPSSLNNLPSCAANQCQSSSPQSLELSPMPVYMI